MGKKVSIELVCQQCGGTFHVPRRTAKKGRKFCGRTCFYKSLQVPVEDRFWRHVQKSPDPDGCWLWTGATWDRYGTFHSDEGTVTAHRFSYEHFVGPIPEGMKVCHTCDTTLCIRPSHLFTGTNQENAEDASQKGRICHGERHPFHRLTREQVFEIRARHADGVKIAKLAADFGVSRGAIGHVVRNQTWKEVGHEIWSG